MMIIQIGLAKIVKHLAEPVEIQHHFVQVVII